MKEKITAEQIKKIALEFGADLVSIGSISRWNHVPPAHHPKSMLPSAKSVIGLALRVHRGTLMASETDHYFSAYTLAGFNDLNKVLAPMIQHKLASYIEDLGYATLPIMYYAHTITGRRPSKVTEETPETELRADIFFDFRLGGVLTGLGEIGHSRLLLTPEFGPAQRLYFLVTEAELDEDPIVSGLCDNCMECVRKCPAKALSVIQKDDFAVGEDYQISRSTINNINCRLAHMSGAFSPFAPKEVTDYALNIINGDGVNCANGQPIPSSEEINQNVAQKVPYTVNAKNEFHSPAGLCGHCVKACLNHLSESQRLYRRKVRGNHD